MEDAKTFPVDSRHRPGPERLDANQLLDNFRRGLRLLRPEAERIMLQYAEQDRLERARRAAPIHLQSE